MYLLVINPGSTSTKVGLSRNSELLAVDTLQHAPEEMRRFRNVMDQKEMRRRAVEGFLSRQGLSPDKLSAVAARGGLLDPVPSGTYAVNAKMLEHLLTAKNGEHASNLGAVLAKALADRAGISAFVVDPPSVDELEDWARFSGRPELPRVSFLHALNICRAILRCAAELGRPLQTCHFVAVHLGGGISVVAVKEGRIVDVSNANHGGPFSPERSGSLPARELLHLCFSGRYGEMELRRQINGKSGLLGYLGTNAGQEIEKRIEQGDEEAGRIFRAMAYQIAKEIGAMAAVLPQIDGLIYTGGLAHSELLLGLIQEYVGSLAPAFRLPGEDELAALAEGAYRVLSGKEEARVY